MINGSVSKVVKNYGTVCYPVRVYNLLCDPFYTLGSSRNDALCLEIYLPFSLHKNDNGSTFRSTNCSKQRISNPWLFVIHSSPLVIKQQTNRISKSMNTDTFPLFISSLIFLGSLKQAHYLCLYMQYEKSGIWNSLLRAIGASECGTIIIFM